MYSFHTKKASAQYFIGNLCIIKQILMNLRLTWPSPVTRVGDEITGGVVTIKPCLHNSSN